MRSSQHALVEAEKPANLEATGKPVDLRGSAPDGAGRRQDHVKSKHWARLTRRREPLRGAVNSSANSTSPRGRRHLVRARRDPPPRLPRWYLDELVVRPQG